jgi:peptidoglycan/LPS O-acetylase OafA/YrhL
MKISYRPEINGLRAIAVFLVIIYHAKIPFLGEHLFQGGFLGVDIFFVISGYLISFLILKELKITNKFSFLNFFERRIRRIIPLLLLVILISFFFAKYYFLPKSLFDFLRSILFSIGFSSNYYFYYTNQIYGAEDSLLKPLLHTWSLSVEEQFYILFPIFLYLIYKYFKNFLLKILLFFFFLSLISTEFISIYYPKINFYFLNVRVWELLSGSFLAYLQLNNYNKSNKLYNLLPALGFFLITISVIFINDKISLPSIYSVPVVLGTFLIIRYTNKKELIFYILSNKILVFFGLISYSLYLWHYPIFAFYRYAFQSGESSLLKYYVITILFLMSLISYFFIEKPFRNVKIIKFKTLILILLLFIFIILLLVKNSFNKNNDIKTLYGKISIDVDYYNNEISDWFNIVNKSDVFDNKRINIIIFGDSLAKDSYVMFKTNSELFKNYSFKLSSYNTVLEYTTKKKINLSNFVYDMEDFEKADVFLLSTRNDNLTELDSLVKDLKSFNKNIILNTRIEAPHPGVLNITKLDQFIWLNKRLPNKIELDKLNKDYFYNYINHTQVNNFNKKLKEISLKYNVRLLDKSLYVCNYNKEQCLFITPQGDKINRDTHHYTLLGNKYLGERIYKLNLLNIN